MRISNGQQIWTSASVGSQLAVGEATCLMKFDFYFLEILSCNIFIYSVGSQLAAGEATCLIKHKFLKILGVVIYLLQGGN